MDPYNIFDIIIIAVFLYSLYSYLTQENFEVHASNSLANNDTYNNPEPKINYTPEYVTNNYTKLLYEFTMDIERKLHNSSKLKPDLKQVNESLFSQASKEKRIHHINTIVMMLNKKFNKPTIEYEEAYGIKEYFNPPYIYLLFKVKLIKEKSNNNTHNKILCIIDNTNSIYQVRLYGLQSIDKLENNIINNQYNLNIKDHNMNLTTTNTEELAKQYIEKNHNKEKGRCVIKESVEDNIGYEIECKLNNGIWEIGYPTSK